MQARLAAASAAGGAPPGVGRSKATDLVECVRCGMFVPNGTICRSVEECSFRRKLSTARLALTRRDRRV